MTRFPSSAWLRFGCLAYALGAAWQSWGGTSLGSFLFMDWEWPHPLVQACERGLSLLLLLGALHSLDRTRHRIPLALLSGYACLQAWAAMNQGGAAFSALSLPAHALRIVTPLALLCLWVADEEAREPGSLARHPYTLAAGRLLRFGTALTFATHGWEAWQGHPRFIDYLLSASDWLPGPPWSQTTAENTLKVIGIADGSAALLVLTVKRTWVAAWPGGWGLLTAAVRPLESGVAGLAEFLLRAPHFTAPWTLARLHFARVIFVTVEQDSRHVHQGGHQGGRGDRRY